MRRKQTRQDSLELFLDTICNMFGGFVFIMLFVVVSIRSTTDAQTREARESGAAPVSDEQVNERAIELERIERELDALGKTRDEAAAFAESLVDKESLEAYRAALDSMRKTEELTKQTVSARAEIADAERRQEEVERENERLREEIAETEQALEKAKKDAKRNVRSTSPPMLHKSDKREIACVLKYGRLYFWHKYGSTGVNLSNFNEEDFFVAEVVRAGVLIRTEPKPGAGIDLGDPYAETLLDQAFLRFNPRTDCVALAVFDDSFSEYETVCSFLKKRGFEISPWVLPRGEKLFDTGGSDNPVQ